ncbi:hypothetical protein ES707_03168 [subsurface metagenome]|jgi:hypothetical protein
MDEKRKKHRQRVFKSATIEFHGGAIDCIVKNISAAGAALEVTSPLGIPERFDLVIPAEHFRRPCRLAWRKATRIGVEFDED